MKQYKRFTKDVGLVATAEALLGLQTFILLPILAKFLGARYYGIWAQINTTVNLLSAVALLGFGSVIIRYLAAEEDKKKVSKLFFSALSIPLILGLILSALLFIFAEPIAIAILKDITTSYFIKLSSILVFVISINQLIYSYFTAFRQIKYRAYLLIIQSLSSI